MRWFLEKLGIECKIGKKWDNRYAKDYYQILIPKPYAFFMVIKDYVPKSMRYKLGEDLQKKSDAEKKLKNYESKRKILPERVEYLKKHYKDYYWKNKTILTIKKKEYEKNNRDKINKRHREYINKDKEKWRKHDREYMREYRRKKMACNSAV